MDELETGTALVMVEGGGLEEMKKLPRGPALDEEGRHLRQVVLSHELSHGFGPNMVAGITPEMRALCDEALLAVPNPSDEEMEQALAKIREQRGGRIDQTTTPFSRFGLDKVVPLFVGAGTAVWTIVALLSCCGWPGGLSFRLFGLSLRSRNGRRARRWLGLVRVLAFAVPLISAYAGSVWLLANGPVWAGWALFVLAAAAHVAGIVLSIATPSRGPIDRLLGTRIVPR